MGLRLAPGVGRDLLAAPMGGAAAFLRAAHHPEGPLVPPDAWLGELALVAPSGQSRSLGVGATNLAGAALFSPDGRSLAYLRHFQLSLHLGELALAQVSGGEPRVLAAAASFFGYSPDGRLLAYIEAGHLWIVDPAGGVPRALADGVTTFEFSSDARAILYRRSAAAGAELILASIEGDRPPILVARGVADYRFDRKGQAIAYTLETADRLPELHLWKGSASRLLGTGAPSFAFSPDGKTLAYVAGVTARYLEGDLYALAVDGGAPQKIGEHAGAYTFAPEGGRLAFLRDYYDQARSGKLALWAPGGGAPQPVANDVRLFGWSHKGGLLAFLKTVTRPLYTEQLFLVAAAAPTPVPRFVGQAIYSFDFTPDDAKLLFKTGCTSGGEACDLLSVPTEDRRVLAKAAAPAPAPAPDGGVLGPKATRVVAGLWDYDFSPDGRWIWVTFTNPVGHSADLAVIPAEGWSLPRYLDRRVEPHPRWLADGRVAYLVSDPRRAGLYVADPAKAVATVGARR